MKAYFFKIANKQQETTDAFSFSFEIPNHVSDLFAYKSGQYITIEATVNGEKIRRSYSMSSSPVNNEQLTITIKKVEGGRMSNHLINNIKRGYTLKVFPPEGRFFVQPDKSNKKHYALFAAGSGITPVISILKTVLVEEPESKVSLFYGNRNISSIIFKNELTKLENQYAERLTIIHYLSKTDADWKGNKGRIDQAQTEYLIGAYLSDNIKVLDCYTCGPSSMIDNIELALKAKGVAETQIHHEYFVLPATEIKTTTEMDNSGKVTITFKFDEETHTIEATADKSILDSIIDAGHEVPYSCQAGACCSCMALLTEGDASTQTQDMLTAGEKEEGLRLTCQAKPLSPKIFVDFDEA